MKNKYTSHRDRGSEDVWEKVISVQSVRFNPVVLEL